MLIIIDKPNPYNYSVYFTPSSSLFTDPIRKQIMSCLCIVLSAFFLPKIALWKIFIVKMWCAEQTNPRYLVLFSPSRIVTSAIRTSYVYSSLDFQKNVRGSIPITSCFWHFCNRSKLGLQTHYLSDHKHRSMRM